MPYTFRRTGHRRARQSEVPFAKPIDIDHFVRVQKESLPYPHTGRQEHNLVATNRHNLFPYFQGKLSFHPGTEAILAQLKLNAKRTQHMRDINAKLGLLPFPPRLTLALRKNQKDLNLAKLVNRAQVSSVGGASLKHMGATIAQLLSENPALPINVIRFQGTHWYYETYQAIAA